MNKFESECRLNLGGVRGFQSLIWRDEGQLTGKFLKALKVSLVKVRFFKVLAVGG